jgi:hypothetical protein
MMQVDTGTGPGKTSEGAVGLLGKVFSQDGSHGHSLIKVIDSTNATIASGTFAAGDSLEHSVTALAADMALGVGKLQITVSGVCNPATSASCFTSGGKKGALVGVALITGNGSCVFTQPFTVIEVNI